MPASTDYQVALSLSVQSAHMETFDLPDCKHKFQSVVTFSDNNTLMKRIKTLRQHTEIYNIIFVVIARFQSGITF